MIVLGLSGLPNSQDRLRRTYPNIGKLDERICQGLDSAAALVVDGEIVAAAAEERFTGEKGTGRLPLRAIDYCLSLAGISSGEVDAVAHGFNYDRYRDAFAVSGDEFAEVFSGRTVIEGLMAAGWNNVEARFRPVDHHDAHAASAVFPSGFRSGLAVVSDGMGEVEALSVYRFEGDKFNKLHSQPIVNSLGLLYSISTRFLGFQFASDEYKVMGLAPYGDPSRFRALFESLAWFDAESGGVTVDWPLGALNNAESGYPHARDFLASMSFLPRLPDGDVWPDESDFAAALQERLTSLLTHVIGYWLRRTGERQLCLAGGTFLNCKSNQSIASLPEVEDLFVQPASGDDGTSLGAALRIASERQSLQLSHPFDPYLGPSFSADEVRAALGVHPGLVWREVGMTDAYFSAAASDLASDLVIGWFHGRMEFGPRALGNRSILALPNGRDIKDRINRMVKFRESFRPFAPAVLIDDRDRLFDTRGFSPDLYMLATAQVHPEARQFVDGIVHADGSARIQTVTPQMNPVFAHLLSDVRIKTGVGCVVNTSFNVRGQPLIMDPATAVDTFVRVGIDRLYIEGFIVEGVKSD